MEEVLAFLRALFADHVLLIKTSTAVRAAGLHSMMLPPKATFGGMRIFPLVRALPQGG